MDRRQFLQSAVLPLVVPGGARTLEDLKTGARDRIHDNRASQHCVGNFCRVRRADHLCGGAYSNATEIGPHGGPCGTESATAAGHSGRRK